jgi:hypothetical protein
MTKRMLSQSQQALIKDRLKDISKRLRKWPYPIMAPEREIADIVSELEGIIRLNMDEHFGPITLFDRAIKWQRNAQLIQGRRQDYEFDKRQWGHTDLREVSR